MLLQSWGGKVRVFPSVPAAWSDVSFTDLRAEGGFIVSATRRAGKTVSVSVTATVSGTLRLKVDGDLKWTTPLGSRSASTLEIPMKAGQEVIGRI